MAGNPEVPVMESDISPVKQVALTVPTTDDDTLPVLTFRMWVLGILCCIVLSIVNQFFWYRTMPFYLGSTTAQIAVVPLGHLMAKTITDRVFYKGSRWEFTLNPGPFNIKEHVLITIFAGAGAGTPYATHIVTAVKVLYKKKLTFIAALIVMMTTQIVGFGYAGLFRRYLVEPAEMWWPGNLINVSLFRALHEKETRLKGGLTRTQFFIIVLVCSFAYCILPGYLFPMLASMSWVCWVFPKSVLAHQLGSGMKGLGIGSFSLDWNTISSFGNPLAFPWFASANIFFGFVMFMYGVVPIAYWSNLYKAKTFPLYTKQLFTSSGKHYDIDSIINSNFNIDLNAYNHEGPLYMSTMFTMSYGFGFAALTATVIHIALFHGREIWRISKSALNKKNMDVHTRLMRKYKQVPHWWFMAILLINLVIIIFACEYYNAQLQLPWWGVLLAVAISGFYMVPIGILYATAGQAPGLNIITEYIFGYIYPGRPVANMCFKVYGYISMQQGLSFISDFKLGHYMKIPPRSMFMAQVLGTVISTVVYLGTGWYLIEAIPNICDSTKLPPGSPWTCPGDITFYDASIIWGLIGPRRVFGNLGTYSTVNYFFIAGAILPLLVWIAHKTCPQQKWIGLINFAVIFSASASIPPLYAVNYLSWFFVAFLFGFVCFRYRQDWWRRNNYVLGAGLDGGVAFTAILTFLSLGQIYIDWWGSSPDGCALANCPTAKGVIMEGCPVF
ncbi:hypothetical protein GIB67_001610 [Kingdonia uniflora]|uniref:Oligopeptide transporter n=1 Tax=Kingdonia uniflora TaxID=39325 RepID=A0A7J7L0R2_9MAGN|nr:hypothetical protein GIB67_001610 [Kingdonia uniflora]